jgi:hypothetical protein
MEDAKEVVNFPKFCIGILGFVQILFGTRRGFINFIEYEKNIDCYIDYFIMEYNHSTEFTGSA